MYMPAVAPSARRVSDGPPVVQAQVSSGGELSGGELAEKASEPEPEPEPSGVL